MCLPIARIRTTSTDAHPRIHVSKPSFSTKLLNETLASPSAVARPGDRVEVHARELQPNRPHPGLLHHPPLPSLPTLLCLPRNGMVLRRIITRLLYSPTRHLVLRPPSASGQRVGLSSTRAPHLSPQLPQLRRRPTSPSSSSASSRSDVVRFDSTQRALYSSGVDGGLHESGGGSSRLDLPWGVDPSGGSHPASRTRLPLPGQRIPGLRGFIKDPATYKSLAPKPQMRPSVDKEVDVRPSPPPRRPAPPPARRARSTPALTRTHASPAVIPPSALRRRPERVPIIVTPFVETPVVASPELATTIPTPRLDPLASLGPTLVALLESPATPLEGLSISPAAFSRVVELVGSQTATFSARELAEEADKTAHELDTLVRTREQAARLVLKMTENRSADCLSMADEYWVQRAWLQLSLPGQSGSVRRELAYRRLC